jgi:hypothetical protein
MVVFIVFYECKNGRWKKILIFLRCGYALIPTPNRPLFLLPVLRRTIKSTEGLLFSRLHRHRPHRNFQF